MEAESQAVLNTLTQYDFYSAFRKWQTRWELCIRAEGDYFEGDGDQQAQIKFMTRWRPVPGIMDLAYCTAPGLQMMISKERSVE
jgi:hypothetical protein